MIKDTKKKTILKREGPISLYPLVPEQALSAFMETPVKVQKKRNKNEKG